MTEYRPDTVETPCGLRRLPCTVWEDQSGTEAEDAGIRNTKTYSKAQAATVRRKPVSGKSGVRSCAFEPRRAQHGSGGKDGVEKKRMKRESV